jgi:hypothetical protein
MSDPDLALKNLELIIADFAAFCEGRGKVSEADTRAKVIDRVLREVCGWPEGEIAREDHLDSGYMDYSLSLNGVPVLAVEAKREGIAFILPEKQQDNWYNLDGALVTDKNIKAAINQVRTYCDDADPPIKYAIATNGYTWIVFRAVREDMSWKKGRARVFRPLESIKEGFNEFWNFLSYISVAGGSLGEAFTPSLRASRQLMRVNQHLYNADLPLQRNHLNNDLRPLISLIFEDIADQDQLDVLQSCYVHTGSLKVVANDLDHIITDSIPQFLRDEGAVSVGEGKSLTGFEQTIACSLATNKGKLFLLLGGIGSGKTTFLKRYQRTTGREHLEKLTLWFRRLFKISPQIHTGTDVRRLSNAA